VILLGFGSVHFHPGGESLALSERVAGDSLQSNSHFIQTFLAVMTPRGMCMHCDRICRLTGLWWWVKGGGLHGQQQLQHSWRISGLLAAFVGRGSAEGTDSNMPCLQQAFTPWMMSF